MSSVCWLLIGDGRDVYHETARASLREHLPAPDHVVEIDDREHRLGFAGAIAEGWRQVLKTGADYCVHAELDFAYERPVPLDRVVRTLERHPELAQLVFKRQAWNPAERAAGGIIEQHPSDYVQRHDACAVWTEHRRFWSTNPGVYSTAWCRVGWPQVPESEGIFTHRLLENRGLRFAFWGAKADPPMVTHLGEARAGWGY